MKHLRVHEISMWCYFFYLIVMKSIDFRQLAIIHYHRLNSYRKAAKIMNVAASTVFRWVKNGIVVKKRKYFSGMYEKVKQYINDIVAKYSGIVTYQLISNEIMDLYNIKVSTKSVGTYLRKMNITPKMTCNKTLSTTPQEDIQVFKQRLCGLFDTNQTILSVDECYFSEKVLPRRGYWYKGKKLVTNLGPRSWKKRSLLMSIGNDGTNYQTTLQYLTMPLHIVRRIVQSCSFRSTLHNTTQSSTYFRK